MGGDHTTKWLSLDSSKSVRAFLDFLKFQIKQQRTGQFEGKLGKVDLMFCASVFGNNGIEARMIWPCSDGTGSSLVEGRKTGQMSQREGV